MQPERTIFCNLEPTGYKWNPEEPLKLRVHSCHATYVLDEKQSMRKSNPCKALYKNSLERKVTIKETRDEFQGHYEKM